MTNPIKIVKVLDIQGNIPPVVYHFFFASTEINGNDASHTTGCNEDIGHLDDEDFDWYGINECWDEWMKRQSERGQRQHHGLGELLDNPITGEEAYRQTIKWLEEQGVTPEDDFMVNIWW